MAESWHLHYHHCVREKVLRYIRDRRLMSAGDRVCVAVSGGADSVALLRVLLELRTELGIVVSVAHFNHGLRGEASEADEAFVAELARQYDLEFFCDRGDVRDHALTGKLSVEAAARELRYCWLTSLAETHKLDEIATGHTLDDQAETVLLKFLRGAGTRGLAGIYPEIAIGVKAPGPFQPTERGPEEAVSRRHSDLPQCKEADKNQPRMGRKSLAQHGAAGGVLGKRDNGPEPRRDGRGYDTVSEAADPRIQSAERGPEAPLHRDNDPRQPGARIVRPLLEVTREEVELYLTALGQSWREDESNLDHRFARNRVRHELLPLLEREYNPNIRQVLSDAAELSRAEEEYWRVLVERELEARQRIKTEIPPRLEPSTGVAGDGTAEAVPFQSGGPEPCPTVPEPASKAAERTEGSGSADLQVRVLAPYTCHPKPALVGGGSAFPTRASARLGLGDFAQLPLALQRRLLKRLLESQQIPADFQHIEKLLRCALGELPKAELPAGWLAVRQGGCLELRAARAEPPFSGYQYTLPVPGEVRIAELGLTLRSVPVPQAFASEAGPPDTLLSAELLGPELIVRNWRPGDRFWPLHSKSEEKLKRLFAEQHIPAEQRPSWPLVLCDSQIVWVRGFPVARAFAWSGSGDAVKIELL
jgi:tRNA(Ile)-lysidine synthetase-like protein